MKVGKFEIYIGEEFYRSYDGKEVLEFILNWDRKLTKGKVLSTTEGNMRVETFSLDIDTNDTELYLSKI